ncbi:MAG: DNA repair protein RadA [Spirochaetes bacterium]|nr:DNA repair protein RadA [Spirochaetota bacterium]
MKKKKRFVCKECGYTVSSWIGKCPECFSWNSFIEEVVEKPGTTEILPQTIELERIQQIQTTASQTLQTSNQPINEFFGDGIVCGSVTLMAGEPGVGKSTFLLYLTEIIDPTKKIFYFSGEESKNQIKKRFDRVSQSDGHIFLSCETRADQIVALCKKEKPDLVFIDSVQTCYSESVDSLAGTISQIKHCSAQLIQLAKQNGIPVIIVGHVTKSGDIAGPKMVEHMVDVVIYFENEYKNQYRVIRSIKNRYGSIDELLVFEMTGKGLSLIENISQFFIEQNTESDAMGKCKTVILEGRHPLIIEVEALVVPSTFPNPRRFAEGIDIKRINRIAAILNKHCGENLNNYDIYVNITGGIKTADVGIDFAIAAAIFSSKNKISITSNTVILGELSLTGKIRPVYKQQQRYKESQKFGFSQFICPDAPQFKDKIEDISQIKTLLSRKNS